MPSLVSSLPLLIALAAGGDSLDELVSRAEKLHDDCENASPHEGHSKLWSRIRKVFDKLEKYPKKKAVAAIANFYDFPDLDHMTTAALVDMDTKTARKAIVRALRFPERARGRSDPSRPAGHCRRARILDECHDLSGGGLPASALEAILVNDRHPHGVQADLRYIASRLTPGRVESVLSILDETSGSRGLASLDARDCEDAVFECIIDGLRLRGRPPTGPLEHFGLDSSEESSRSGTGAAKTSLKNIDAEDADEIFATLLDYASSKKKGHAVRAVAMRALGAHQRESLLDPLRDVFETQSDQRVLVLAATRAALSLQDPRVGAWLLPIIEDSVDDLREDDSHIEETVALVQAIYPLQIKDAAQLLTRLARSKNHYLRMAAVTSLPILGEKDARPLLKRYLDDTRNWRLQIGAIEACRTMRLRMSVDLLIERMDRERGRLQYDILAALHDLTGVRMPYVSRDWEKWWDVNRAIYKPPEKQRPRSEKRTMVMFPDSGQLTYFGIEVISNRLCFVADTSGSMSAEMTYPGSNATRIDAMKVELRRLVKTFDRRTYFNFYFFESVYKKLFEGLTQHSRKSEKQAKKFLDSIAAGGGTNIYDPLENALLDPNVDTIYLLSDGAPTDGKYTAFDDILRSVRRINRLRKIQINTIAIGSDSKLLRRLAAQNGGFYRSLK